MASPKGRAIDPLDEAPYVEPYAHDPRDVVAIPHRFHPGIGVMTMRKLSRMADGLYISNIYWTYGKPPPGAPSSCVSDPPSSGWGRVLVVEEEPNARTRQVLCMWSFRSFVITAGSHEWASMHGVSYIETDEQKAEWLRAHMWRKWAEVARAGERAGEPDWRLAKRAMELLGVEPPSDQELVAMGPAPASKKALLAKAAEKPTPKTPTAAFKSVKRAGRKGEVLQAILEGTTSADALTAKFAITRSNLLSQLFLLRKDHGIGYTTNGDHIAVQVPEGVEVFI